MMSQPKSVVVLGGGFAGVEAAIHLSKNDLDVILVSDRDYFYIYPTSIWIPTGEKRREDVSVPLDQLAMAHGFKLIIDPVAKIEAKENQVTLESGRILDSQDYLVLALGQDKLQLEGMEHTLSICGKPEEATALQEQINTLVNRGSRVWRKP
jgi:sulfide:quinone oxidoreductase